MTIAADKFNNQRAIKTLASCYLNGIAVEKDPQKGKKYLERLNLKQPNIQIEDNKKRFRYGQ